MDFIDRIRELSSRVQGAKEHCETEEATKTALIMPLIAALGYDVFNPREVVPEFVADIGTKKGEKVDYAIVIEGEPVIIFECKWSGADLNKEHASQLHRYFGAVHSVRFGVLTNGVEYRFYTDLDAANRMDDRPFFVFNALDFQDREVGELKKFTKSSFDIENIVTTANELKYTAAIKNLISTEFDSPSDDFVAYITRQVYSGRMTQNVREQFSAIVAKALRRFIGERVNERIQSAIQPDVEPHPAPASEESAPSDEPEPSGKPGVETTDDELEAFMIVRAILRSKVDVERVAMRDTKSYCGVLLDNNNRKPLVRLRFNRTQKYLGLFDLERNEITVPIDSIDEIYNHGDQILATLKLYVD